MTKRLAFALLLTAALTACQRTPTSAELEGLVIEVPALRRAAPLNQDIPAAQWPDALKRLAPKRVYNTADGLYIVTSSFFVTEQGIFVPRNMQVPPPGSDPAYTPIGSGFYSYRIEG
ncbi:hypothetical protein ASD78_17775 [Lysobacter sp. Root667]|uniref:hypothetical protein n=1 Tax=Lysobacter sp. Root667 TaxID=1736581 RepID=UPI0006FCCFD4|nr:hypothetical protein [Lysobacter sp. Root667]KRA70685.1 hypothetical protein ASD78_17775 [Lysobacter sp. Root667]